MSVSLRTDSKLINKLALIRLVLMDVDGTLVTGPRDTLGRVVSQLQRLRAHGIRFSVATGRTLFGAATVVNVLQSIRAKLPPIIAYNGAVVAGPVPVSVVDRSVIAKTTLVKVVDVCRRHRLRLLAYSCEVKLDLAPQERVFTADRLLARRQEFNGMPVHLVGWRELCSLENVVALVGIARSPGEALRLANAIRPDLNESVRLITSGSAYVEITSGGTTKLAGMLRLAEMLRLDTNAIMAIGDSFNDLEMIEGAGLGVAVANAPEIVKRVAPLVCTRNGSEGVVEILRVLLDAHRVERLEKRIAAQGRRQ